MLLREYRRQLGLSEVDNYSFRYDDRQVPRSRIYIDYTAQHPKLRYYLSLLGALLQSSDISSDGWLNEGRYYRVTRCNGSSSRIEQSLYTYGTLNFWCASSHAQYEAAVATVTASNAMLGAEVRPLDMFTVPGAKLYVSRPQDTAYVMNASRIFVIVDNNAMSEELIELCANAWMYMTYTEFMNKDTVTLEPDQAQSIAPSNMLLLWNQDASDYEVPTWMATNIEGIIAQRRAEQEERERREAEERQRLFEQERLTLQTKSIEALQNVQIVDRSSQRISSLRSEIESYRSNIRDYMTSIQDYKARIAAAEAEITAWALQSVAEQSSPYTQLKDMIGLDKCVRRVTLRNEHIARLFCVSPIIFWEADEVAQWKQARDGEFWDVVRVVCSGRFQYMTGAKVEIDFSNSRVSGSALEDEEWKLITNTPYLANHPHVGRYSCFGNNEYAIRDELVAGHFDTAVTYINSCMMQLNLTDGCVVTTMAQYIKSRANQSMFYDTVDKKYCSYNEALTILNQEDTDEVH